MAVYERDGELVLKKSPSWCLRGRQQQGYKQTRVSDATGNRHSRRLAAYDGATRPFGVAVLLLPHRRSGSSKPLVTFHRPLRQLRFCAVQATAARLSQESAAARDMIDRYYERYGRRPMGVAADNTYGNGELLQWLDDRGITPYIRVKEGPNSPPDLYGIEKFTYVPEENCYLCPAGQPLNYVGINKRNRAHRYYSTVKRCRGCGQKPQCTRGKFRTIAIHTCEAARQKADEVAKTPEFAVALRKRRKVEALFSELKNLIGLRRLRLRRIKFVREQFYLAAVAQNLKRLVRFLNMRAQPAMASA